MEDSSLHLHFPFWLKDRTMGSSSDRSVQGAAFAGFGSGGGSDSWGGPQAELSLTPNFFHDSQGTHGVSQCLFLRSGRRNTLHPWRRAGRLRSLVLRNPYEMQVKIPFLVLQIIIIHSKYFLLKRTAIYLKMRFVVMLLAWF